MASRCDSFCAPGASKFSRQSRVIWSEVGVYGSMDLVTAVLKGSTLAAEARGLLEVILKRSQNSLIELVRMKILSAGHLVVLSHSKSRYLSRAYDLLYLVHVIVSLLAAPTGTSCESYGAQGHDKRNVLWFRCACLWVITYFYYRPKTQHILPYFSIGNAHHQTNVYRGIPRMLIFYEFRPFLYR